MQLRWESKLQNLFQAFNIFDLKFVNKAESNYNNHVSSYLKTHKISLVVIFLISLGALLRFYNLNWGAPYYFHPDERNIADLVLKTSLANPESLLRGTFAYGNFPVILTLLIKPILQPVFQLLNLTDSFAQAIITLRILSGISSIFMLYVIYLCGKFWSEKAGILSLFLATFSTGFIQQAHFGTYDGFVAFCAVSVFYFLLRFLKSRQIKFYYLAFLFIALGAAAKINLLILAIFPAVILLMHLGKKKKKALSFLLHAALAASLMLLLTAVLSPNYLTSEFRNALMYERGLVAGDTPVFYTQSFYNTTPIHFQFLNIYPFLINPVLTILFLPSFFYLLYKGLKTKNPSLFILNSFFLLLFLPQAFLFAKWTRYMIPTLPFAYLIIAIAVFSLLQSYKQVFSIRYLVLGITLTSCIIFSISYFITAFIKTDARIEAAGYARQNFPNNSRIITEPYDLGITPFNSRSFDIEFFNFYDLESDGSSLGYELNSELERTEYLIIPSQRLLRSRLLNEKNFPKGHKFYSSLINEDLGFEKIYQTPCDVFCRITYLGDPVFYLEETSTVFDRPTVFIYKKLNSKY
jgi:hypothetical protein